MKKFYVVFGNGMDFLAMRDYDKGESDTAIVDWDLSEKEYKEVLENIDKYESIYSSGRDASGNELDWKTFDEITQGFYTTLEKYMG